MNTSTVNIMTTTIPVVAAMTIITTTSMLAAVAMTTIMITPMLTPMPMQVVAAAVATTMATRKTKALASNSVASSAYLRSKFGPS